MHCVVLSHVHHMSTDNHLHFVAFAVVKVRLHVLHRAWWLGTGPEETPRKTLLFVGVGNSGVGYNFLQKSQSQLKDPCHHQQHAELQVLLESIWYTLMRWGVCFGILEYEKTLQCPKNRTFSKRNRHVLRTFFLFCFRSILAELDKGVHLDQIMIETTGTAFEGRAVRAFETWIRQMNFRMLQYYDQCPEFMWLRSPEIFSSWIYHQHIPNLSKIIILYCGQIWRKHVGFWTSLLPSLPKFIIDGFHHGFLARYIVYFWLNWSNNQNQHIYIDRYIYI